VAVTIPHPLRIGVLVLATTAFYGYVGQMVPQKEVQPPQETVIRADLSTAEMVTVGSEIFVGKGLCSTCHTLGKSGALRFPDLAGIGERAAKRIPGLNDVDYIAQSMYEPDSYIVEGFNPGMPVINKPPIGLTDQEILCVIAYLQSLGGKPTVTLATTHRYRAAPATPTPGAVPPPGAPPGQLPLAAPKKDEQPAKGGGGGPQ
jgi:mono/diheme cytochrome c family protein